MTDNAEESDMGTTASATRGIYKVERHEVWSVEADSPEEALHHVQDGRRSQVVHHAESWSEPWLHQGVCPACPERENRILVGVQGQTARVNPERFPGGQLWDLALYAHESAEIRPNRPEKDWEFRDNHGGLHAWSEHVTEYPHSGLYVVPRAGVGA